MKISEIFEINQGHQITDEEIYKSIGNIPIITGNNEIKGYWNKAIISEDNLPCITYPTKGFSGKLYIQKKLFDANNTAVLYYKKGMEKTVELEYVKNFLKYKFLEIMTSKENISYLNREIVENIDIEIPSPTIRKKIIDIYQKLENNIALIENQIELIHKLLSKQIIIENNLEKVPFGQIFSHVSRNDALSEEGLYNYTSENDRTVNVLSGGSENINYGQISKNIKGIHYLMNRQGIHIITRGNAGKLTFLPNGNYATNTNAYLLYIKKENWSMLKIKNAKEEEIYLKYIILFAQGTFYKLASLSDLGVFPLSDVMENYMFPYFKYNSEMKNLVYKYWKINTLLSKLNSCKNNFTKLLSSQIVY